MPGLDECSFTQRGSQSWTGPVPPPRPLDGSHHPGLSTGLHDYHEIPGPRRAPRPTTRVQASTDSPSHPRPRRPTTRVPSLDGPSRESRASTGHHESPPSLDGLSVPPHFPRFPFPVLSRFPAPTLFGPSTPHLRCRRVKLVRTRYICLARLSNIAKMSTTWKTGKTQKQTCGPDDATRGRALGHTTRIPGLDRLSVLQ
jgi:hypothetical protein